MTVKKDGQHGVTHARSVEMKLKLVAPVGKIGARVCAVSAFWSQSMRSKQKISQVSPELTNRCHFYFFPFASLLTECTQSIVFT